MAGKSSLMTVMGVAALWDVSRNTVRKYIENGRLPHMRTITGLILIEPEDAERLLKELRDEYRKRPANAPGRPRHGLFWRAAADRARQSGRV